MSPTVCYIQNCDAPAFRKGLCPKHHYRIEKFGDPFREPQRQADLICSVEGCTRSAALKGVCRSHYVMQRDTGRECSVEGCTKPEYSRLLCRSHYQTHRPDAPICKEPGCERPVKAQGWCSMHYQKNRDFGACSVDGCDRPAGAAKGLCGMHYSRLRNQGSPGEAERQRAVGIPHTERNGYRRIKTPEYPDGIFEHRLVMQQVIGRPLLDNENVHHLNGRRHDNAPSNLELWVTMQPTGQRPADLVAFAELILERYGELVNEGII